MAFFCCCIVARLEEEGGRMAARFFPPPPGLGRNYELRKKYEKLRFFESQVKLKFAVLRLVQYRKIEIFGWLRHFIIN